MLLQRHKKHYSTWESVSPAHVTLMHFCSFPFLAWWWWWSSGPFVRGIQDHSLRSDWLWPLADSHVNFNSASLAVFSFSAAPLMSDLHSLTDRTKLSTNTTNRSSCSQTTLRVRFCFSYWSTTTLYVLIEVNEPDVTHHVMHPHNPHNLNLRGLLLVMEIKTNHF